MTGLFALAVLVGVATLPLWLGRRLWEMRSRELQRRWGTAPTADLDEPIRAVKWARIRAAPKGNEATLAGLTVGGRYQAEGEATCVRGCRPPGEGCDCGFYAVRPGCEDEVFDTVEGLRRRATSVQLEVELSGEVLEFDLGYRAARQRVLRVLIPSRCAPCARFDDTRHAVAMLPKATAAYGSDLGLGPTGRLGARDSWPVLEPVCDLHRPPPEEFAPIGVVELSGLLGTEVAWAPLPTTGDAYPKDDLPGG
jgi:hypothetical protein